MTLRWPAEPGSQLAQARMEGHKLVDLMIEFRGWPRDGVYRYLHRKMSLPADRCHFGTFTLSQCRRANYILRNAQRSAQSHPSFTSPTPVSEF
jgi:hypothetical protein